MTQQLYREPIPRPVTGYRDLKLNVWDYGGDGRPLMLAHCTGTVGRIWDPVVARLGDQFRVIAPDTRGQGDSETPTNRLDHAWNYSGFDLLAIQDELGLPRGMGAVGHSAGGAHVAYAEHHRPGSFSRIVLIDAVVADKAFFEGENYLATKVARRVNAFDSLVAARARLVSKPPMALWDDAAVDAYMTHAFITRPDGSCLLKCPGAREAWYYELGGASDLYEELHQIEAEVRLMTGADSYAQHWVEAQQQRLPRSTVAVVPASGHFIPQERPAAVAAHIREYFGV